jgi:hypothetical protein
VVIVLTIRHKFGGSNPDEDDGFLRAIKIRSTSSFGGEVEPLAPFRKFSRHIKNPYSMKEILVGKIHGNFSPSFSCFATNCLSGYCQTALVGELGMIRTQMDEH